MELNSNYYNKEIFRENIINRAQFKKRLLNSAETKHKNKYEVEHFLFIVQHTMISI